MSDDDSTSIASRLGLGLAAIGRPAYITVGRTHDLGDGDGRSLDALRERAHDLLDAAWWLGIRYIDCARSYGHAEEFLGSWLAAHPGRRDELTIGSKWGYEYLGDWRMDAPVHERKEHSLAMLDRQWSETRAALGTQPDVYLIHSLTPDSPALDDGALLDRLRELAADGARVGFSTSGPRQAEVIDAALAIGSSPVLGRAEHLEPARTVGGRGVGNARTTPRWLVVVKEALANGRLTADGADGDLSTGAAEALAEADGQSLAGLALGSAVAHPWAEPRADGCRHARSASREPERPGAGCRVCPADEPCRTPGAVLGRPAPAAPGT